MKKILSLFILSIFIISCDQPNKNVQKSSHPLAKFVDSDASKVIDSLVPYIAKIPKSNDTIFLGFRFGMNKKEFRNQVYKLRNEGFTIKYEKDLSFRNPVINYSFNIGSGYTFVTDISCEKYSSDDIYTGTGTYYLRPSYGSESGKLYQLNVMAKETWNNTYSDPCDWLQMKLYSEYERVPTEFRKYSEEGLGNSLDFIYEKENTFVYDGGMIYDFVWQTKKSFFMKLLLEKKVEEIKIQNSEKEIKI